MSFTSFPLSSLGLTPHQLSACKRADLHFASDVLTLSPADLNRKLKFYRLDGVYDLIQSVSKAIVPTASTVDQLLDDAVLYRRAESSLTAQRRAQQQAVAGARAGVQRTDQDVIEVEEEGGTGAKGKGRAVSHNWDVAVAGAGVEREDGDQLCMEWGRGNWVSTGDPEIDQALWGGFRVGHITELTGESAAGKSQFTLALALAAQLPDLTTHPGGTIMINTEGELETNRLVQLVSALRAKYSSVQTGGPCPSSRTLMDNIHTKRCEDIETLEHTLSFVIPTMVAAMRAESHSHSALLGQRRQSVELEGNSSTGAPIPIRLLIIDSITTLLRYSDQAYATSTANGLTLRSKHLCSITDKLKALAVEYELAIVVVNQVSDVFTRPTAPPPSSLGVSSSSQPRSSQFSQYYSDYPEPPMIYSTQARWFSGQSESLQKEASLGIVWANAINTRIMLSRTGRRRLLNQEDLTPISRKKLRERMEQRQEEAYENGLAVVDTNSLMMVDVDEVKPTLIRRLHVVFSNFAPPGTVDYVITSTGIHSIPDSYRLQDGSRAGSKGKKGTRKLGEVDADEGSDGSAGQRQGDGRNVRVNGHSGGDSGGERDDEEEGVIPTSDDYGSEMFDDLGEMPAEFWEGH